MHEQVLWDSLTTRRVCVFQATATQQRHSTGSTDKECHQRLSSSSSNNNKISSLGGGDRGAITPVYHRSSSLCGTPPGSPQSANSQQSTQTQCRRLLQETLSRPGQLPLIVAAENGGYWVDGTDHECSFDLRGAVILPHGTWRAKIETDDTAKCYRRFFHGRVSLRCVCFSYSALPCPSPHTCGWTFVLITTRWCVIIAGKQRFLGDETKKCWENHSSNAREPCESSHALYSNSRKYTQYTQPAANAVRISFYLKISQFLLLRTSGCQMLGRCMYMLKVLNTTPSVWSSGCANARAHTHSQK